MPLGEEVVASPLVVLVVDVIGGSSDVLPMVRGGGGSVLHARDDRLKKREVRQGGCRRRGEIRLARCLRLSEVT